jgi:predicted metal-binding protein
MHTLSVCRNCPRDRPAKGGLPERLRGLAEDAGLLQGWRFLTVECLGGCPKPSAVVFDAPEKWRIRLTGLTVADAADLFDAARAYAGSADGQLTDAMLPPALQGHISARSPKRPGQEAGAYPSKAVG